MSNYSWKSFSAINEDALGVGSNLSVGESFTYTGATATVYVCDDDAGLGGDRHNNEQGSDSQAGWVLEDGEWTNIGNAYWEGYFVMHGSDGQTYYLIEVEGSGSCDDYFTFYGRTPATGVTLTAQCYYNDCGDLSYACLGAGSINTDVDPSAVADVLGVTAGEINANPIANILSNDSSNNGEAIVVKSIGGSAALVGVWIDLDAGGRVLVSANGDVTFDDQGEFASLAEGETATVTLSYTIENSDGNTDSATLTVNVTGVDDLPVANDVVVNTDEDTAITGNIMDGATDVDGDVDLISVSFNGQTVDFGVATAVTTEDGYSGTLLVNADGTFTFTPGADANDMEVGDMDALTFTYTIDAGTTSTQTRTTTKTLDFEGFNRGTVIENQYDGVSVTVDAKGKGAKYDEAMIFDSNNPTGGDHDLRTSTQNNILIISEDGHSHDPDDNAQGGEIRFSFDDPTDVSSLTLIDNQNGVWIGFFDDNWQKTGEKWVSGAADNSVHAISLNGQNVSHMLVVLKGSGAIDDLVYTTTEEFQVRDTIDGQVTVNIEGLQDNEAPVVTSVEVTTDEDTAGTGNVLVGATDADGDTLTVTGLSIGAVGDDIAVTTDGGRSGTVRVEADGSLTYTPGADAASMTADDTDTVSFTYTVSDGNGGTATETVTVTIDGNKDCAIAVDDTANTNEDTAATGNVLTNDIAGDSGNLEVTGIVGAEVGVEYEVTSDAGRTATFILNADGTYTLTPTDGFDDLDAGQFDTFSITYSANDCDTGTGSGYTDVLIRNGDFEDNDAPRANNWNMINELPEWTIVGGAGEIHNGLVGGGDNSSFELDAHHNVMIEQTITAGVDGKFSLDFEYTPRTTNAASNSMEVLVDGVVVATISEGSVNTFPQSLELDLTAGDHVIGFRGTGTSDRVGARIDNVAMERLTEPEDILIRNGDFEQNDVSGSWGLTNNIAEWTNTGAAAEIQNGFVGGAGNAAVELDSTANYTLSQTITAGMDGTFSLEFDYTPRQRGSEIGATSIVEVLVDGVVVGTFEENSVATFNKSLDLTLTAGEHEISFRGAGSNDSYGARIDNVFMERTGNGTEIDPNAGSTGVLTVTVEGVTDNTAPVIADVNITLSEDETGAGDVLTGSVDAEGDTITVASTSLGALGVAQTAITAGGAEVSITVNADGTYSIDPQGNLNGLGAGETDTVSFTLVGTDGSLTDNGTVTITFNGVNDGPVVADSSLTLGEDETGGADVLVGAIDADGDTVTVATTSLGAVGVAQTATTAGGAEVLITVNADGSYSVDPQGNLNGLGAGETDTASFTFTGTDGSATDTGTVTITFNGANDGPVVADSSLTLGEDETGGADVLVGAIDADGDTVTVATTSLGAVGVAQTATTAGGAEVLITVNADGSYSVDPQGNLNGLGAGETDTASFTFTGTDGSATDTGTVTITFNGANDGPVVADSSLTLGEDETGGADVLVGAIDADGDTVTVATTSLGAVGVAQAATTAGGAEVLITVNADGSYSVDPQGNLNGLGAGETDTASFTFTGTDGSATDTGTVTITFNGANDGPVVADSSLTLGEDETGGADVLVGAIDADGDTVTVATTSLGAVGVAQTATTAGGAEVLITVNADGSYSVDPQGNLNGLGAGETDTASFTFTGTDGSATDTGTVTITFNGANDGPVVADTTLSIGEDEIGGANALAGAIDADGDTVTVASSSLGALGVAQTATTAGGVEVSITVNADGTYSVDPLGNLNGLAAGETDTVSFTVTGTDGSLDDNGTVTITFNGENDGPVTLDTSLTLGEDDTGFSNVLDGATDAEGDTLAVSASSVGALGTTSQVETVGGAIVNVTVNADGTYSVNPMGNLNELAVGETDSLSFTYTADDGNGGSSTSTVNVVFEGRNDGPVAIDDFVTTNEDALALSGNVLGNDRDVDNGSVITLTEVSTLPVGNGPVPVTGVSNSGNVFNGTVTYSANGDYTLNVTEIDALAVGERVDFEVAYTITDEQGATDTGVLNIRVTGDNDAPSVEDFMISTTEDAAVSGNALTGATDVDNGDTLVASATSVGTLGQTETATTADGREVSVIVNADGSYTVTPGASMNALATGETDTVSFTVTGSDGNGGTDVSTITVTFEGTNDGPVAVADTNSTTEDAPSVAGNLLANDFDPDTTDSISVVSINDAAVAPLGGLISIFTTTVVTGLSDRGEELQAVVSVLADGTYTANISDAELLAAGETVTFSTTYSISDGTTVSSSTLEIVMTGTNDVPTVVATTQTVDEDMTATGNLLDGSADADGDTLIVSETSLGALGTPITVATASGDADATVTVNADGTYTVVPGAALNALATGESDTVTFTFTVDDGNGGTATETATITFNGANDGPTAVVDTNSTTEDAPTVSGDLLANDTDPDASDALSVISVNGIPVIAGVTVLTGLSERDEELMALVTFAADGSYTATISDAELLAAGETVTFNSTYTITDGTEISASTLQIVITGTNDVPTVVATTQTVDEDTTATGNLLDGSADADGDTLIVSETSLGALGTPITVATASGDADATVTVNADGTYTVVPGAALNALATGESDTVTFTFTVDDGNGGTATETATITFNGANDGPTAVVDTNSTTEDAPTVSGDLLANDTDPDTTDTLSIVTVNAIPAAVGVTVLTGLSDRGAVMTALVTFGTDGSYTAVISDAELLAAGETVTFASTYVMTDGSALSDASLEIVMTGTNDVPTVVGITQTVDEDTTATGNVLIGSADADGDTLTVTSTSLGAVGTAITVPTAGSATALVTVEADGSYTAVPGSALNALNTGESDSVTFTFTVDDGNGGTATETVTITFEGVNDAPVAADDGFTVGQKTVGVDGNLSGNVLPNDTDAENQALVVTGFGDGLLPGETQRVLLPDPAGGLYVADITLNADGTFSFTQINTVGIAEGETETFSVEYTISDGNGGTDTALLEINVEGVNEAPTAINDPDYRTDENSVVFGNLLGNDEDEDVSDVLMIDGLAVGTSQLVNVVSDLGTGREGVVTVRADGTFSFKPSEDFQDLDTGEFDQVSFTYTVDDGNGGMDTAQATIVIDGIDDAGNSLEEEIINMVFVIDNSFSMLSAIQGAGGTADLFGNQDGIKQHVDWAIQFTFGMSQSVAENRDIAFDDFTAASADRDFSFINQGELDANGTPILIEDLTPEERGGTIVRSQIFGFGETVKDFGNFESDDAFIDSTLDTMELPLGSGSNYTLALEAVADYLESSPAARQTKVYFLSDSASTTNDFGDVARRIEEDYGAQIEAINLVARNRFDEASSDLDIVDTTSPGETIDTFSNRNSFSDLIRDEEEDFVFDPTSFSDPTILDENGVLIV